MKFGGVSGAASALGISGSLFGGAPAISRKELGHSLAGVGLGGAFCSAGLAFVCRGAILIALFLEPFFARARLEAVPGLGREGTGRFNLVAGRRGLACLCGGFAGKSRPET